MSTKIKAVCGARLGLWSPGGEGGTSWLQSLGREKEPTAVSSSSSGFPAHLVCVVPVASKPWVS